MSTHISPKNIRAAAKRVRAVAVETPLLSWPILNEAAGGVVLVTCENLQRTGSFKIRGAYNRICQLSAREKQNGVVAFSTGNHAQGVALAAKLCGVKATIFMPRAASPMKVERTRRDGAVVEFYDAQSDDRLSVVQDFIKTTGAAFVPPYDDADIICGQGTIGVQVLQQLKKQPKAWRTLDQALVCTSGGGLMAGIGTALHAEQPACQLYTVEPDGYHDTALSLAAGQLVPRPDNAAPTLCDALNGARTPGTLTWPVLQQLKARGIVVTEKQVKQAMCFAYHELKMVVEPGGAVALAAVLSRAVDCANKTTWLLLSGGNVDAAIFADIIQTKNDAGN